MNFPDYIFPETRRYALHIQETRGLLSDCQIDERTADTLLSCICTQADGIPKVWIRCGRYFSEETPWRGQVWLLDQISHGFPVLDMPYNTRKEAEKWRVEVIGLAHRLLEKWKLLPVNYCDLNSVAVMNIARLLGREHDHDFQYRLVDEDIVGAVLDSLIRASENESVRYSPEFHGSRVNGRDATRAHFVRALVSGFRRVSGGKHSMYKWVADIASHVFDRNMSREKAVNLCANLHQQQPSITLEDIEAMSSERFSEFFQEFMGA